MTLFTRRIEFPKVIRKTKSHILATPNTASKWLRFSKKKIRDEFTSTLTEYIIPEAEKTYDNINIQYRLVRHNKRKIDSDSASYAMKWLQDTLEAMNYIADDKDVTLESFPTIVDPSLPETMIDIRITDEKKEW
jgi:hypothetical protein